MFDRYTLTKGAFALEIVCGDSEMAAYLRVSLRDDCNSRFDNVPFHTVKDV